MPWLSLTARLPALVLCLIAPVAVRAACTVSSSGVAFGTYNPFSTSPTDATGDITLTCTAGSGSGAYSVGLSVGGGSSYSARRMTSGSNLLPYQVYSNAARSTVWGDGTAGTSTATAGDNRPQVGGSTSLPIYGRIVAQIAVAPGSYSDTLTVTVVY